MKKRKKKYVAPVGIWWAERSPNMAPEELWAWLGECCRHLKGWVPYGEEPDVIGWDDPEENARKGWMERLGAEQDHAVEVRDAFEVLAATKRWPEVSETACYLMQARLEWGLRLCKMGQNQKTPQGPLFSFPTLPTKSLLQWLLFDLYEEDLSFPAKWWR